MVKSGYKKCYGCLACLDTCPKSAIEKKKYGPFNLIKVNKKKCVNCGLCEKVCPINVTKQDSNDSFEVWALKNKNDDVLFNSSSGGFVFEITKFLLNQGYAVFETRFDSNFKLIHERINNFNSIGPFLKSKYLKADTNQTFKEVKELLNSRIKVAYIGTPCEIAALNKFLGKKYENLFLIDFACHGAPSQPLFNKYIKELEKQHKSKIKSIDFRSKEKGWNAFRFRAEFENGDCYSELFSKDPYMQLFLSNYSLYESCYSCAYKGRNSFSDISIADFWGIEKIEPSFNDDKGVSFVLLKTQKAKHILDNILDNFIGKRMEYDASRKLSMVKPPVKPLLGRIVFKLTYKILPTSGILFLCKCFNKIDFYSKRKRREYWKS